MPARETLTAVLQAREQVTGALDDIEQGALAAATAFETAQEAADAFERGLDGVERGAGAVADQLSDIAPSAGVAATAMSAAEERADELGDEFTDTAVEAGVLGGVMSGLPAAGALGGTIGFDSEDVSMPDADRDGRTVPIRTTLDTAAATATRTLLDTMARDRTVNITPDLDIAALAGVQTGLASLSAPDLSAPNISPDTQTVPFEAGGAEMPDLSALQFPATDGGQELSALGGAGHVAAEGLDAASAAAIETSAANALAASEADDAADGLLSIVPGGEAAASALDDVRSSAFRAVPGLTAAKHEIDETGDEAATSAAQIGAMQSSMTALGGSGVGTELLGFHGSLSSIATILPLIISLVGGLVAPLGAVATAGGAAGGALAAMAGAGLLAQSEQLVGTYQRVDGELKKIQDSGEAAEVVLGNLKDRAGDIFSQLQTGQTSQFFTGLTEGGFTILEDFVSLTNRLMGPLMDMSDRLGEVFAETEPEGFAELERTTRALIPTLEQLAGGAMRALPDFFRWIRVEGLDTADALFALAGSALDLAVELAEVGGTVWQTVGPALGFLFDVAAGAVDMFTDLPGPLKTAGAAGALAAAGFYALASGAVAASGATTVLGAVSAAALAPVGALATAVGVLTSPLFLAAAAIGAVVGAGALLINHFGLMDDIVGALTGTWNVLVEGVEWAANALLNLYDIIKPLLYTIPGIGQILWIADNWSLVSSAVNDAVQWMGQALKWFGDNIDKWLGPVDEWVGKLGQLLGGLGKRGPNQARVDLSGFKAGQGGRVAKDASGGPGSPAGTQQPPGPGGPGAGAGGYGGAPGSGYGGGAGGATAAAGGGGGTTVNNTVNYYEQNGDATSGPARDRRVRNIVRQMNDETRRAGSGMN